ncbi:hypothetical protein ST201phi2-1p071 [Pseudomonas phage 201phi2-1]|uniref:Lipoprotein n=1 Tax=Pseudomonas phage 201phi2-1 TaxID=198110 RepID=B3FK46_BP201|nr:hypothetical protein ST201phi2-1p071 [Pseudomonas phage 201phi2-1]ABY62904.1 hypothetical protein 201phi2-1p071 [Pseudomonas phage 201phi2-1]
MEDKTDVVVEAPKQKGIDLSWVFFGMLAMSIGSCSGMTALGNAYQRAEEYKADKQLQITQLQIKHQESKHD